MTDKTEIQELMTSYAHGSSFRDFDLLMSTFVPEGSWELEGSAYVLKGQAAMREAFAEIVAPLETLVQMNSPALISVSGDHATARSFVRETGKMSGRDEWVEIVGYYDDELTRTAQGWRFTLRKFTVRGLYRTTTLPGARIPVEQP